jgi:hypothetical protein
LRRSKNSIDAVELVERHGVVLASAKGPVPNLADAIAGCAIRGSWWGHAKGGEIFTALGAVADSADVLCFRLVDRKLTFVHRRLWPALVRLADELGAERLTAIKQEHTASGAHRNVRTPFPQWVPPATQRAAESLSTVEARAALGSWCAASSRRSPRTRRQSNRDRLRGL